MQPREEEFSDKSGMEDANASKDTDNVNVDAKKKTKNGDRLSFSAYDGSADGEPETTLNCISSLPY